MRRIKIICILAAAALIATVGGFQLANQRDKSAAEIAQMDQNHSQTQNGITNTGVGVQDGEIEVDLSASYILVDFMRQLKTAEKPDDVEKKLDQVLATRPYRYMFLHYNRSNRPNELPEGTFKRLILSTKFQNQYRVGENGRADTMKSLWQRFFNEIDLYERRVAKFDQNKIQTWMRESRSLANQLLPPDMHVPPLYFFFLPQGGSSAFVVPQDKTHKPSAGIDLLQLAFTDNLEIEPNDLQMRLAHEIHHLGYQNFIAKQKWDEAEKFLALVLAEGVANKLINNLENSIEVKTASPYREILTNEAEKEWRDYLKNKDALFTRFNGDINNLSGKDKDAVLGYWWGGDHKGRLYFIGTEIVSRAFLKNGLAEVWDLMRNPSKALIYLQ